MKQQTAVQFLFSELERCQYFIGNDIYQAYKEALEKEKGQIMDARMQDMDSGLDQSTYIDIAEDYYNETYLNKKL